MIILSKKVQIKTLGLWIFLFLILSCNSDNTVGATDDEIGEEEEENPISLEDRLPQVFVDTKGGTIVDEPKISSDAVLVVAGDTIYNGNLGIEFRGATSQLLFPKKS